VANGVKERIQRHHNALVAIANSPAHIREKAKQDPELRAMVEKAEKYTALNARLDAAMKNPRKVEVTPELRAKLIRMAEASRAKREIQK